MPIMVSREELVAWAAIRYGARFADERVTDHGFAFLVSTQPDGYHEGDQDAMTYGNGPVFVIKATGHAWFLASNPPSMLALGARSEAEFEQLLRDAYYDPDVPDEILGEERGELPDPAPQKVLRHQLVRWLRSFGWPESACEITDRVFAFVVVPTPAIPNHNGPIVVVKRTAGVWYLGAAPDAVATVGGARTEAEFYSAFRQLDPYADPRVPHDRVPQRFARPFG
jgi:hypothetical protein